METSKIISLASRASAGLQSDLWRRRSRRPALGYYPILGKAGVVNFVLGLRRFRVTALEN